MNILTIQNFSYNIYFGENAGFARDMKATISGID
jgi:hypothetical protein